MHSQGIRSCWGFITAEKEGEQKETYGRALSMQPTSTFQSNCVKVTSLLLQEGAGLQGQASLHHSPVYIPAAQT